MKLHLQESESLVTASEMMDGQIGIIRKWDYSSYIGMIVQKFKGDLITLGLPSGNSFTNHGGTINNPLNQIEILPPGTLLEI